MSAFFYYLMTFAESVTSIVGIRAYEQPRYAVIQTLPQGVEVRRYEPREAIEAVIPGTDRQQAASQAFSLLFRYITGANQAGAMIAMTAPVSTHGQRIAMTAPVQTSGTGPVSMRFFLPRAVAAKGAPEPTDPRLHLVQIPEATVAALRYSGVDSERIHDAKAAELLSVVNASAWRPDGEVLRLSYDPPFTIPFLRRNEAAVPVTK
jgi:hypothetical protein